ncbi:MAG: TadE/TadG family type IV pilus assembly protein, partial [Chloroflexota bacterium]
MAFKRTEKGQALILVALAAVGLFAFAALAIDGSRAFSDKRHAQNAADTAVLAGALAYTRASDADKAADATIYPIILDAASKRADSNGYYNDGIKSDVIITAVDVPAGECPGEVDGKDITVKIVSYVDTTLARILGREKITNAVTATSRACGFYWSPLFNGDAIVGLNPTTSQCAFDSGTSNSAKWKIKGSGLFSNGCAYAKNNASVNFVDGDCATAVGTASNFTCSQSNQIARKIKYPEDVLKEMPANPCDGTPGDIGLPPPASGSTFTDGVYCIANMDDYDSMDIVLNNATLYVTDTDFELKFAGGGGFSGTPTSSGAFEDYYMVVAYESDPCEDFNDHNAQIIQFRGNGSGTFSGTILAPSACLDLRGNGEADGIHTQLIGYNVSSNGDAEV